MLEKTITFTDYNGVERTEKFYFNLSTAELAEMELSEHGGLSTYLERLIALQDIPEIMEVFKNIIKASYGEKSPDGRRFIKNQEVLDNFMQTEAYTVLYMELASSAEKSAEFVKQLVPKKVQDQIDQKVETDVKETNLAPAT